MTARVEHPAPDPTSRSQAAGAASSPLAQLPMAASRVRTKKLSHKQKCTSFKKFGSYFATLHLTPS